MVPPRKAIRRRPPGPSAVRSPTKSPTRPRAAMPGYSRPTCAKALSTEPRWMSNSTQRRSEPARFIASSSTCALGETPPPSSTSSCGATRATTLYAQERRISSSVRVW